MSLCNELAESLSCEERYTVANNRDEAEPPQEESPTMRLTIPETSTDHQHTPERLSYKLLEKLSIEEPEERTNTLLSESILNNPFTTSLSRNCPPKEPFSMTSKEESPPASQVSVGSLPPSLVASLLPKTFDHNLTPVTRNTSYSQFNGGTQYVNVVKKQHRQQAGMLITPPVGGNEDPTDLLAFPTDYVVVCPPMPLPVAPQRRQSTTDLLFPPPSMPIAESIPVTKTQSFTSRQEHDYQQHRRGTSAVSVPPLQTTTTGLRPYQPSHRHQAFDFGSDYNNPQLQEIFTQRHLDSDDTDEERHHRLELSLDDERSIPSIRMANHLHNTTTDGGSYSATSCEDEDSLTSLREEEDDMFLVAAPTASSASSNLAASQDLPQNPQQQIPRSTDNYRKRKKQLRAERVYAWLQSVEADPNDLAEAASSKFLTGKQKVCDQQSQSVQPSSLTIQENEWKLTLGSNE